MLLELIIEGKIGVALDVDNILGREFIIVIECFTMENKRFGMNEYKGVFFWVCLEKMASLVGEVILTYW